jgi:serine/threonine protein kinase
MTSGMSAVTNWELEGMTDDFMQSGAVSSPDAAESLPAGIAINGYQIEGIAGRGGMGVVYRAMQQWPQRTVAVKVIRSEYARDPDFRRRFQREVDVAASIEHPNVIPIYGAGEYDGLLYLAMRYIEGTDLREWLLQNGAMPPTRAARIVVQIGEALDAAHSNGLVHRDVKPGNVLLTERSARDHVYLTDFGLTKKASGSAGWTKSGTWVGTVDYSAPEQIRGEHVDARADVYALGCLLFELLSGQVPFERDSDVSKLFAHVNDPPPSLGAFSPSLGRFDHVIQRALSKDPNDRFMSAGDLGRAALAAAEMRSIELKETVVATGEAAPAVDPNATKIDEGVYTPPLRTGGTAPAGPSGPSDGQGGGGRPQPSPQPQPTKPRPWLKFGVPGVLALVVVGVVVAVLASSGGKKHHPVSPVAKTSPDVALVRNAVNGWYNTSGSGACQYLSPANVQAVYGGYAGCQKQLAGATATPVSGPQKVQVTGTLATDSGFTWEGHPMKITLVKQNGRWLIDTIDDADYDAIQTTVSNWDQTNGPDTCNFFTQHYLQNAYNGSLSQCQSQNASFSPSGIQGSQNINETSATQATDQVTLKNGKKVQFSLVKQTDDKWLIDDIQAQ